VGFEVRIWACSPPSIPLPCFLGPWLTGGAALCLDSVPPPPRSSGGCCLGCCLVLVSMSGAAALHRLLQEAQLGLCPDASHPALSVMFAPGVP
jgi:hypothetical protein